MQGSNYAGSLGVYNNPASMVNTPVKWDLTVIGIQAKYQTNAIRVDDYSLLGSPANSKLIIRGGNFDRYGNAQANVNLFTTRIAWGRNRAISFGANIRSFAHVRSNEYFYRDTISSVGSFLDLNQATGPYNAKLRTSNLLELCLSYGQTIIRGANWRLNGGLTFKVNRGLFGAQATMTDVSKTTIAGPDGNVYQLTGGVVHYGYSSNVDRWNNDRGAGANLMDIGRFSRSGFSMDAGVEWLKLPDNGPAYTQSEDAYYDYDWKISASLLDVGWGQYRYGTESRRGVIPPDGPNDVQIDQRMDSTVKSLSDFSAALGQLIPTSGAGTNYKMYSPMRVNLNVDRWITQALYLNADLSINVGNLLIRDPRLVMTSMNLFRLTPRWELRRWGVYLPLQYNTHNQFWVGAAGRIGPLLIGFHNLANVFSKNAMANGGGYIALTIRSSQFTGRKRDKNTDCPPF